MTVYGEAVAVKFANKHAGARRPLARFLEIAKTADWPHFAALKGTFSTADLGKQSGRVIFDIGGNKYRLIATINFERQILLIEMVLTHEEYDREVL